MSGEGRVIAVRAVNVVVVTGGRDNDSNDDYALVRKRLDEHRPDIVVQGGARGIDACARNWCERRAVPCLTVHANWSNGPSGGPARNQRMLELALQLSPTSYLLAFPGGRGTADCVYKARMLGMTVQRCLPVRSTT